MSNSENNTEQNGTQLLAFFVVYFLNNTIYFNTDWQVCFPFRMFFFAFWGVCGGGGGDICYLTVQNKKLPNENNFFSSQKKNLNWNFDF